MGWPLFVSPSGSHLIIRSQDTNGPAAHTAAQRCLERKSYVESNCPHSIRIYRHDGHLGPHRRNVHERRGLSYLTRPETTDVTAPKARQRA